MAEEEKSEVIMVRVSARDKKAFEDIAAGLDMKVSEFLRAAALFYLTVNMNPHALKLLAKGVADSIKETMHRLREPGLRKALWGVSK
jgi:hypothetical protein